ncbi:hypothetical protein AAG565_12155 [Fontimonas sp. SYSU GA230001]|uniref:hypothetical protein n=1 Tax=Fontimonas sp. SYSU GA230001 TaxID=3142450 RepID=UPI0032B60517
MLRNMAEWPIACKALRTQYQAELGEARSEDQISLFLEGSPMPLTRYLSPGALLIAYLFTSIIVSAAESPQYLTMGEPVPVDQPITLPPEPYNPTKHGDLYVAPMVERQSSNAVDDLSAPLPYPPRAITKLAANPLPLALTPTPTFLPGSGDRGFWVRKGAGLFAGNDAQLDFSIPNEAIGAVIYAPTDMPRGSCVEATTVHYRYEGFPETVHAHGFWDHCEEQGWQVFEFIDTRWTDRYVRIYDGELTFFHEVYQNGQDCWIGVLYNFQLGRWEEKTTPVCGAGPYENGWTMWESYGIMDNPEQAVICPRFPNIRSKAIQWYDRGTNSWSNLTTSDTSQLGPYGDCWTSGAYSFRATVPNSYWEADTD